MSARNYVETFGAGETKQLPGGRYFFVRTALTAIDLETVGNRGAPVKFTSVGAGSKYGPVDEENAWRFLKITSAAAQNVEVIISDDGDFEVASTVTVSGGVTTSEAPSTVINPSTSTAVLTTTNLDIAANLTRKRITICNPSSNTASVFLRDQGGTGDAGIEIQPGMFVELRSTAAFRIRNNSAVTVTVTMFEES